MSKTPSTDALDAALKGEWNRCYALMHVHAVKLETALTDADNEAKQSREELIREKAVADTLRDQLKAKKADEPACLNIKPAIVDPSGCCDRWKGNSWRLNVTMAFHDGLRTVQDETIKFCPWCGIAR